MKRILVLANNGVGLYKFRREVIEALLSFYEVIIALPDGEFVREFQSMGCRFYNVEMNRHGTNPFKEIKLYKAFEKIIDDVAPDVVLTYTIKPNIYGGMICARKHIPYIVNITGLGSAVENQGVLQLITIALYRYALRKANKVFFQNTYNRDYMCRKRIVKNNFDLLPGSGVNIQEYQPLPYPKGDTIDFFFVARVMKEKGIEQFLDAARYFRGKNNNTRFHICGAYEESYQPQLDELQRRGIVEYHGVVIDMIPMYQMASCVVHPTYYPEGMSNVLLESCACGRPIITTDRPGCREIVEDGKNGFVCQQKNSEDLIRQIEKFLQLSVDERQEMGLLGRAKIEKQFDRKIVLGKYIAAINDLYQ